MDVEVQSKQNRSALSIFFAQTARMCRRFDVLIASLVLIAIFLWLRRYENRQIGLMNPDEADLIAAGKLAAQSLLPYDRFTTSTYGPLWPMFLGGLHRLGLPMTLVSAHVLASVLTITIVLCWFWLLRRRFSYWLSFVGACALTLVWGNGGLPRSADFTHLSSELLPTMLLATAAVAAWVGAAGRRGWRELALVLCTCAALAKYQLAPLAVLLFASIVVVVRPPSDVGWRRRAAIDVACGIGTVAVLSILVLVGGHADRVFTEALPVLSSYVSDGDRSQFDRLSDGARFVFDQPYFLLPLVSSVYFVRLGSRGEETWRRVWRVLLPGIALSLAIIASSSTPSPFAHYSQLFIAAGLVAIGASARPISADEDSPEESYASDFSFRYVAVVALCLVGLQVAPALGRQSERTYETGVLGFLSAGSARLDESVQGAQRIVELCPPGSPVVAFGWSAELYSYFDWEPATRFTINTWQTNEGPNQARYQAALFDEIDAGRPTCVVDAVGPAFFPFSDPTDGLQSLDSPIMGLLNESYKRHVVDFSSGLGSQPLNVYVRR